MATINTAPLKAVDGWTLVASGPQGFVRIASRGSAPWFVALSAASPPTTLIGEELVGDEFFVTPQGFTENVYVRAGDAYGELNPLVFDVTVGAGSGGGGGGGGVVTQPDGTLLNSQVTGNLAHGAVDAGNPVKIGGKATTTLPTATADGNRVDAWFGPSGEQVTTLRTVNVSLADAATNNSIALPVNSAGTGIGQRYFNFNFNGSTWDRARGDTNGTYVGGNIASGATDAGNPLKFGGVFNTTLPTVTTGQRVDAQFSNRGEQLVALSAGATPITGATTNTDGAAVAATSSSLRTAGFQYVFNGTTWDRQRKANVANRVASSAAAGNPAVGKATAGDVKQFWGLNTTAAVIYLQIYNKATAPVLGTDTPVLTYPIPASAGFAQTVPDGFYFATGIAYAFTTDVAGATGTAAAAVSAFNLLVA